MLHPLSNSYDLAYLLLLAYYFHESLTALAGLPNTVSPGFT